MPDWGSTLPSAIKLFLRSNFLQIICSRNSSATTFSMRNRIYEDLKIWKYLYRHLHNPWSHRWCSTFMLSSNTVACKVCDCCYLKDLQICTPSPAPGLALACSWLHGWSVLEHILQQSLKLNFLTHIALNQKL